MILKSHQLLKFYHYINVELSQEFLAVKSYLMN